jgi:Ca2+-binding EF-hand superfamily protein
MSKGGGAHADSQMQQGLPAEVARLPQKLMRAFREAFSKFDPANDDVVPSSELLAMLHSLSLNPTERELKSASDELLRGGTRLSFVVFCRACGSGPLSTASGLFPFLP